MEEREIKLTAQEMDFIANVIKQISITPANPDAISILAVSQSILSKITKVCQETE